MRRSDKIRELIKVIKPYGLSIVETKNHRRIYNSHGKAVYWFSSSPSCPFFAENTLKDLIKKGLVPENEKYLKIR